MSKRTIAHIRFCRRTRQAEAHGNGFTRGDQRGYKQSGRKLLMRDGYDAMEAKYLKVNAKGLKRDRARQAAAEAGAYPEAQTASHWKGWHKAMDRLNARDRKAVYALLWADSRDREDLYPRVNYSRAQRRAIERADQAGRIDAAMEWDRKTLANAY